MRVSKVWLNGNELASRCLEGIKLAIEKERQENYKFYQQHP
jgi:hypothetical protein